MSILMLLLFSLSAFAVDVGNWYLTGQKLQKAADAAALAGVPHLPSRPGDAFTVARRSVAKNGFSSSGYPGSPQAADATVTTSLAGTPTRLRVTVASTVDNVFGGLLGISSTTIVRTSVADYAGPVPLGSPCNKFGSDPEATDATTGAPCDAVKGQFWTNIGSLPAPKTTGDAFHNGYCASVLVDNCTGSGSVNTDYAPDGYFYSVTLTEPVHNLVLQAFDPALIHVGDFCERNLTDATGSENSIADLESVRYAGGAGAYCTGDIRFGGTGEVSTQFTVRRPVASTNPWDPLSYEVVNVGGCAPRTFPGFNGNLATALDEFRPDGTTRQPGYNPYVAEVFRRWTTLCTVPYVPAGTYLVQVKTNGLGTDLASGHNRFSMRAFSSSDPTAADSIALAGDTKMAIYANLPSAQTEFHLARLPSGAAGQVLTIKLFDIGDSNRSGVITVKPPVEYPGSFTNCTGAGPGVITNCSLIATSLFNGKWQTIAVRVPDDYTCDDADPSKCWVRLEYDYGVGAAPSDTTSWTASLDGDPVRLVE